MRYSREGHVVSDGSGGGSGAIAEVVVVHGRNSGGGDNGSKVVVVQRTAKPKSQIFKSQLALSCYIQRNRKREK